ncbi:MAG: hypothetical protein DID91_2727704731 [Candidatus Nitrotoga sp. MKT]|nr:MAG: hypothetical protein DID91_2727704731 [Candidatus Nitrotoga sp. MKT]
MAKILVVEDHLTNMELAIAPLQILLNIQLFGMEA